MRDTQYTQPCNETRNVGATFSKNTPYGYIFGVLFDNNMSITDRLIVIRHYKLGVITDDEQT